MMNTYKIFKEFLDNLVIKDNEKISDRYKKITKNLNQTFYSSDSETDNTLQIGSFGRKTAVDGVSDLDMVFEMPPEDFSKYNNDKYNGQSKLLQDVKNSIKKTYPKTDVRGDGQVVVVSFTNYVIEVCPGFIQDDKSYKYPDTHDGGTWKKTNPRPEIAEINRFNKEVATNLKHLCKMTRAWKNKCGVKIGGLLIDTLCYKFLESNEKHQSTAHSSYDELVRDFFKYLSECDPEKKYWLAPGSNQRVYKKAKFINKAEKAHENICEAIEKADNNNVYSYWRKIFGRPFPYPVAALESSMDYTSKEEYIEDSYPVDIRYSIKIDCEIKQNGFRDMLLREYLKSTSKWIKRNKKLIFKITNTDVDEPYTAKWKIRNIGSAAKERNCFRGQILDDDGSKKRIENSSFQGPHYVECYIIKDNVCVARDHIDVPIGTEFE